MLQTQPLPISHRSRGLDQIIPSDPLLERLAGGFKWAEGPLWLLNKQCLIFSDISGNTIYQWEDHRGLTLFRRPSSYANGNSLDLQNRLVTCEHAARRVSRTDSDGRVITLASHYEDKRLNSPNDVVVRSDGTIYFTDPPYGFSDKMGGRGRRELDFQGVYRLSSPEHSLILEVSDFQSPNGLAFSPDECCLYVADSDRMHIRVFDVQRDGSLTNSRIFVELDPKIGPGWPDGIKTDTACNVYVTGPSGIWIFDSKGELLGILEMPETATNMNWGGVNRNEFYITTATEAFRGSFLYRLKLNARGSGRP